MSCIVSMVHVTHVHRGKATARQPRGRGSTETVEVRHGANRSSKPVAYTQAAETTTNHENEPRRAAENMKPARESDGTPTPRKKFDGVGLAVP